MICVHINAPFLAAVSCEPPQRKPVTPATVASPESSVCGNPHTGVMCSMSTTGRYVAPLSRGRLLFVPSQRWLYDASGRRETKHLPKALVPFVTAVCVP